MKKRLIIEADSHIVKKIFNGYRGLIVIKFNCDITKIGFEQYARILRPEYG